MKDVRALFTETKLMDETMKSTYDQMVDEFEANHGASIRHETWGEAAARRCSQATVSS